MFSLFIYKSRVTKTKVQVGYKYICIRITGINALNSRSRK